jgi:hypothetical protein
MQPEEVSLAVWDDNELKTDCDVNEIATYKEETIRDIDHWVNPPKSQRVMQPFDDATGQCLLGTCQWVFEEQTFKSWMANDTITMNLDAAFAKILWIKGIMPPPLRKIRRLLE